MITIKRKPDEVKTISVKKLYKPIVINDVEYDLTELRKALRDVRDYCYNRSVCERKEVVDKLFNQCFIISTARSVYLTESSEELQDRLGSIY